MCNCAEVCELIELSFGVVSGVGGGMGVLGRDACATRGRSRFGIFHTHWFELAKWRIFAQKCIRLVREKLTVFPYA